MFGYCDVNWFSASPTVAPLTSTESFCSVNCRNAVGIKILAISTPHDLPWSDRDPAGNCSRGQSCRFESKSPRMSTTGRNSSSQFRKSKHRNRGGNEKFRSGPSLATALLYPLSIDLRDEPDIVRLAHRSRRFQGQSLR